MKINHLEISFLDLFPFYAHSANTLNNLNSKKNPKSIIFLYIITRKKYYKKGANFYKIREKILAKQKEKIQYRKVLQ